MSVDTILQLGSDALLNQWEVLFPNGIPGGGNPDAVRLRMDQTFTMPDEQIATYEIDFRGAKLIQTAKKEDTDKTLTIPVRIDQQWSVYDDLRAWHQLVYDPITNISVPNALTRAPMILQNLDESKQVAKAFTFSYCKLKNLKVNDWDMASSDPARVELTIIYGYMKVT